MISAALLFLLLISCGGGGGGSNPQQSPPPDGGTPPPVGGTKADPAVISLSTPTTSTIVGVTSSYYLFTTGTATGSYAIALTGVQADLGWDLFAASDYSSFFVATCDKQFSTGNEICSATLTGNTTYYLKVRSWDNTTSTYTLTVSYLDPATGCGAGTCVNFESGSIPVSFVTSGDAAWAIDSGIKATGVYSAHSGTITDNQTSCFAYTPSGNTEVVVFSVKTDSEHWVDMLKFYIDGTMQSSNWSGNTDWTRVIFGSNSGSHTYKWCYTKDGSISVGSDRVWVDDIEFK